MTDAAPKRVLFFDDRYYAAQGAQKLLVQLAVFARDAGLDVAVGSTRGGALLDLAEENGLETIVLGMPRQLDKWGGELRQGGPSSAWRTTWALARQNVALARQVREQGYDLVWAAAMRAMLSLLATSFVLRVPVVWQIMGSGYFRGFSELASLAAKRIVLIADGLRPAVGVLRSRSFVRRRIRIVQTGLPAPRDLSNPRHALRVRLGLPEQVEDKIWLVSVGAHIAEKGHLDVVEAVRSLSPEVQEQVFLLIGGPPLAGAYHDELERQAAKAPDLVSVHGWVDKVDEWLRSADIYVLASRREGMPLTLVEAMQRRATAVGYPVGGVPELIHDGRTGLDRRLPRRHPRPRREDRRPGDRPRTRGAARGTGRASRSREQQ